MMTITMRITVLALPDQVWNSLAANEEYYLREMTVRHSSLMVRQHEKKRGMKGREGKGREEKRTYRTHFNVLPMILIRSSVTRNRPASHRETAFC